MKKLLAFVSTNLLIATFVLAQAPNSFKYQAVLRDASGNIKASANVNVRVDILQGSATGANVYAETFAVQTNAFGLINLEIGEGTLVSGNFSSIDWHAGTYFIKTSIDGVEFGASQLLSVPYALYAEKANYNNLINKPTFATVATSGSYNDLANQPALFDGTWVSLSGKPSFANVATSGSYNDLIDNPTLFNGNYNNLTNKPTTLYNATYSSATGTDALKSNENTGYGNTAMGWNALESNTTGDNNTAFGGDALKSNISSSQNTAIGYSALMYNTTGANNTATGFDALKDNKTSNSNTAFGSSTLTNHLTGNYNTAIGVSSLWQDTSGIHNTSMGYFSLRNNWSGQYNTACGSKALETNTTGDNNTAVGYLALGSVATGSNNTAIGYRADVLSQNFTNATAIGYYATVNSSNKVRIGNSSVTVIEGQVAFTAASDRRLKKNITDINAGLGFIMKLHPVEYQMKEGDDRINFGFIAQDIEKLIGVNNSMLTIGGDNDRTLGLRYTDFIAPLVKAIQEQQKQIDELKQLVEKLSKK